VRRTVDVLEHRCLWCGEWFEVKRPDLEPKTCSPSCKAQMSRKRRREREASA
jgi:predicted nucleic acid-binding Zn ribbon protein